MNKHILTTIVVAILVAAGAFFGGYKYSQSKTPVLPNRGGQFSQNAGGSRGGSARFGNGNNFVNGTILSKDNSGITVQLRSMPGTASSTASGSKLVVITGATQIFKAVAGTPDDLTVGENVTVTGTDGSSGALTAQTVQVRQMPPPGAPDQGGAPRQ